VGEATIKAHATRILASWVFATRAQIVVLAYETGLVQLRSSRVD
jgi:hypothetical protein